MKKTQCHAVAKSTQQRCEKTAMWGSPYCWLHYPKKDTIEFFILGILLAVLFQMVIDLVTVSSEERDIGLLTQQNRELIEGKNKLLDKIETYQIDLTEKQKAIEELEERAKQASQGVTTVYWFNGTARKTHGPNIRLDHHLVRIFDRMVELQNDKKFMELSQLCEEQIEKHPQWSTPHVFMGVVAANLGDVDRAIRSFQYFLDNAPAEPSYGYGKARAQARELLNSLKSKK